MIESVDVADWKQLQLSVCRLLNEAGLSAEVEKVLETPRGTVEVDVYAVDEASVDKIRYIIECKCWASAIPQHVVHSFTTVMQETGANLGFIVSKVGLQVGAERYTQSTNIAGLTFEALQRRYFEPWWRRHFCSEVAAYAEKVCFYTEPFNTTRDTALERLSDEQLAAFWEIERKYSAFSMTMWQANLETLAPGFAKPLPLSLEEYKQKLIEIFGEHLALKSLFWRDLLDEIRQIFIALEGELHQLFGGDIFGET